MTPNLLLTFDYVYKLDGKIVYIGTIIIRLMSAIQSIPFLSIEVSVKESKLPSSPVFNLIYVL